MNTYFTDKQIKTFILAALILIDIACFLVIPIHFATIDEILMGSSLVGSFLSKTPSPMIYSNILLSDIFIYVYKYLPNAPLYALFLISPAVVCLIAVNRHIYKNVSDKLTIGILVVLKVAFLALFLGHLQFTVAGSVFAIIAVYYFLKDKFLIVAVLTATSFLIRADNLYVIGLTISAGFTLSYIFQSTAIRFNRKKLIGALAIAGFVFLCSMYSRYNNKNTEFQNYHTYRSLHMDYHLYERYSDDDKLNLKKQYGWDSTDYHQFISCYSADTALFNIERLKAVTLTKYIFYPQVKNLKIVSGNIINSSFAFYILFICLVPFLFYDKNGRYRFYIYMFSSICVIITLSLFLKPTPFRVYFPLLFCIPLFALFFFEAFPFEKRAGKYLLIGYTAIFSLFIMYDVRKEKNSSATKIQRCKTQLGYIRDEAAKGNYFILSTPWVLMLEPIGWKNNYSETRNLNLISPAKVSPDEAAFLHEKLKIDNLFTDIVGKENVFVIFNTFENDKLIKEQKEFYKSKYGMDVEFKLYKQVEWLLFYRLEKKVALYHN